MKLFKELRFKRFIERFDLENTLDNTEKEKNVTDLFEYMEGEKYEEIEEELKQQNEI